MLSISRLSRMWDEDLISSKGRGGLLSLSTVDNFSPIVTF